ncbi:MAG: AbrB/MazE/SpoVT family DNA-binding domain-containing protein [Kiritimatiellia bacterium]|jgi:AbrB family looped-hinge helix DNA binding protein|nr:AbrB/MazE/SpoVT family DNA-binding domain-containing protein [Kiritimatiellia bacterium]
MIASMTSKGQVTVPAEARRRLGLHAGSKVDFIINEMDHLEMIPVADSVRELKGSVPKPSRPLSLEEMDEAIAEGARQ